MTMVGPSRWPAATSSNQPCVLADANAFDSLKSPTKRLDPFDLLTSKIAVKTGFSGSKTLPLDHGTLNQGELNGPAGQTFG